MHWSPECAKAAYSGFQDSMSSNMSCLSICSEALVAAVPAPEVTDQVGASLECARCRICNDHQLALQSEAHNMCLPAS